MLFSQTVFSYLMTASAVNAALSSSQFLKSNRNLEQGAEVDYSFLSNYNVLYSNCFQADYSDADNIKEATASFQICPSNVDCVSGCEGGGRYTANFNYFLDAFTELQLGAREYACEMVRESCEEADEDYDDDEYYNCYINAGIYAGDENMYTYCIDENQEEFNLQEFLECEEFEFEDDNGDEDEDEDGDEDEDEDEDGDVLYIGPYCSDSVQIYIGIFSDEYCTQKVGEPNDYEGYEDFPYSEIGGTSAIVEDDEIKDCARCTEHGLEQDQNANDKEDEDDTLEQCEDLYANTIYKCESDIEYYMELDSTGCEAIESMEKNENGFQTRDIETGQLMGYVAVQVIFWAALAAFACLMVRNSFKSKGNKSEALIPNKRELQ